MRNFKFAFPLMGATVWPGDTVVERMRAECPPTSYTSFYIRHHFSRHYYAGQDPVTQSAVWVPGKKEAMEFRNVPFARRIKKALEITCQVALVRDDEGRDTEIP